MTALPRNCGLPGPRLGVAAAVTTAFALALAATPVHAQRDANAPPEIVLPDPMPPVPAADDRLQSFGDVVRGSRAAVDLASLAAVDERMLRYTLVVTSSAGVRNISLEAMRCDLPERRLLALGRTDGTWSLTRTSTWQRIRFDDTLHSAHADLYRLLCANGRAAARDADGLARALKSNPYRSAY